jgi:hypothetical protein
VLSLSPTENKIALHGPASARRGEHVPFALSATTPGPRLIRCHVFAPDGSMLPLYARNLLIENTAGTFVLPSALNDVAGKYIIRATDVVTGATAETKITFE